MRKEDQTKAKRFKFKTELVPGFTPRDRLQEAIRRAVEYDELEPLAKEVESGNSHLQDKEFRYFLADRVAGKSIRNPGEKPKSRQKESRHMKILMEISKHVAIGVPIYANGESKTGKDTACALAASRFHVGKSTATDIWKNRETFYKRVRPSTIQMLEVKLIYKIFLTTGLPPKSLYLSDLAYEAEIAGMLYCASRISQPNSTDFLDEKINTAMREIFRFPGD